MKVVKNISIVAAVMLIAALFSFRPMEANAVTESRSGIDIYVMSKPTKDYDVIESGKIIVIASCDEVVNKCVKKASEAKAQGVIIYWESKRFDAIKYK